MGEALGDMETLVKLAVLIFAVRVAGFAACGEEGLVQRMVEGRQGGYQGAGEFQAQARLETI